MQFDALADSRVDDVLVARASERISYGLALGVEKVLLWHDLDDNFWHFYLRLAGASPVSGLTAAGAIARCAFSLAAPAGASYPEIRVLAVWYHFDTIASWP